MKTSRNQGGFAEIGILVIALVLLGGVGFFAYQNYQSSHKAPAASVAKKIAKVDSLAFASTVDAKGVAVAPAASFAPATPAIYAVAKVDSAAKNSRIEYVRYRDGKFVDNGSLAVAKDGSHNASFAFKLKPGAAHPAGKYKVKIYSNGKFVKSSEYTVK